MKQKTLREDAHLREAEICRRRPRSVRECALAHSRAEARLLQQPSTLAPSAHPRGAFLSYGNEVSYTTKKSIKGKRCGL